MIGQFAFVNFFKTGALNEQINHHINVLPPKPTDAER
jgi:hypothetical protein